MLLLMLVCLLLVVAACGDDGKEESDDVTMDSADISEMDLAEDVDTAPPLLPAALEVVVTPTRPVYRPGNTVTPEATVFDVFGDIIEPPLVWSVEPSDAATPEGDGTWVLGDVEGQVTFVACTDIEDTEALCGDRTIVIDAAAPTLEVTSPLPGEEIDGSLASTIVVEGVATDTHGDVSVFVEGREVVLDAEGRFSTELTPRFGIQHIEVVATDGLRSTGTTVELDVLWAPGFQPLDSMDGTALTLPDALALRLGQRFFDDGSPLMTNPEDPVVASDIADIIELLILNADILGQLPNPLLTDPLTLRITSVDISDVTVQADITDVGLELFIRLGTVVIGTEGSLDLSGQTVDLDGSIDAALSAVASIRLRKAGLEEPWDVSLQTVDLAIDDVDSNFASPEANAVFELAESTLRQTLENLLLDQILGDLTRQIPNLLLGVLEQLDTALQDQSFELDTGLGDPVTLELDAAIDQLDTRYRTAVEGWMVATVGSQNTPVHSGSLGVAQLDVEAMPPFVTVSRVQLGLRITLLNGLLHVLWNSGLLELQLDELLGPGSTVSGKLPPVLHPPLEGEDWDLIMSVGQLEATLVLGADEVVYGVNLRAGLNVDLVDGSIRLEVQEVPELRVWQVSEATSDVITLETFRQIVLDSVWPQLYGAIGDGLEIPLPLPEITGLGDIAPALSNATLDVGLVRDPDVRNGFAIIDARVDVVVP